LVSIARLVWLIQLAKTPPPKELLALQEEYHVILETFVIPNQLLPIIPAKLLELKPQEDHVSQLLIAVPD